MLAYRKDKLLLLMERKRTADLRRKDLYSRADDARTTASHMRSVIEHGAGDSAHVRRLLAMTVAEAAALTREDVEEFTDAKGKAWTSGVNFQNWQAYLVAHARHQRLVGELAQMKADDAQFEIVPRLVDAVRRWGFANPEVEVG